MEGTLEQGEAAVHPPPGLEREVGVVGADPVGAVATAERQPPSDSNSGLLRLNRREQKGMASP